MTFTGLIGRICMFPLRLIIDVCVRLRIHPNTLTFIGVLINVAAAWALALGNFVTAGVIMVAANIFDFIDGKVAHESNAVSVFGGFWDSVIDRFSDISLFIGLIFLYATLDRARLRDADGAGDDVRHDDQLHPRSRRVAHQEMQGRLHGTSRAHRPVHDRGVHQPDGRGAVGDPVLSIFTVADRIILTYRELRDTGEVMA